MDTSGPRPGPNNDALQDLEAPGSFGCWYKIPGGLLVEHGPTGEAYLKAPSAVNLRGFYVSSPAPADPEDTAKKSPTFMMSTT